MRAAAMLAALVLASGCSLVFDGSRHVGSDGQECSSHGECLNDPTANAEGRFFCVEGECVDDCEADAECAGHPFGQECLEGPAFCGCDGNDDCTAMAPFCAPDGECAECLGDGDCGAGERCSDFECVSASCVSSADCSAPTPICEPGVGCVQCRESGDCASDSSCVEGRCEPAIEGCDRDGDGFPRMTPECERPMVPADCDDENPDVYPDRFPDCGAPMDDTCGRPRWGALFGDRGYSKVGQTTPVTVPDIDMLSSPPEGHLLSVFVNPEVGFDGADAVIVHHGAGDVSPRRAFVTGVRFDGPISNETMLAASTAGYRNVSAYELRRLRSGAVAGGVWGETPSGTAEARLLAAGGGVVQSVTETSMGVPWPVRVFDYEARAAIAYRVRVAAGSSLIALLTASGNNSAPLPSVRPTQHDTWIAAADGVIIGNADAATWLWDGNAVDTAPLGFVGDAHRGVLARLRDNYVGLVVDASLPNNARTFTLPGDCADTNPAACASSAAHAPVMEGPPVRLPALAEADDFGLLASANPGPSGGDEVGLRAVAADGTLHRFGPAMPSIGTGGRVEDVAIGTHMTPDALDVVVAAVFVDAGGASQLRMTSLRACR